MIVYDLLLDCDDSPWHAQLPLLHEDMHRALDTGKGFEMKAFWQAVLRTAAMMVRTVQTDWRHVHLRKAPERDPNMRAGVDGSPSASLGLFGTLVSNRKSGRM
jgi:hypothetical protein